MVVFIIKIIWLLMFFQRPGLNFGKRFSLAVNHNTIRLTLAISGNNSRLIPQLDIENAFLHGYL